MTSIKRHYWSHSYMVTYHVCDRGQIADRIQYAHERCLDEMRRKGPEWEVHDFTTVTVVDGEVETASTVITLIAYRDEFPEDDTKVSETSHDVKTLGAMTQNGNMDAQQRLQELVEKYGLEEIATYLPTWKLTADMVNKVARK